MAKRLVICADGTWNEPGQTERGIACPTNIVKIATIVLPQDHDHRPATARQQRGERDSR